MKLALISLAFVAVKATADDTFSNLRGVDGKRDRQLSHDADELIGLGACEDFAVMAGSTATCAGSFDCDIIGGYLGVYPGTSLTGNFDGDIAVRADTAACAADGLAAWKSGTAMTSGETMLAEMGGLTFTPGLYKHGSAINIALANPEVYLDAEGDSSAVFIFNAGTTLTTCASSEIVLVNGARKENVFWVLGTALTMGADSILVGNVLAGSTITMGTNAMIAGRAIAQTAVTCETACTVESSGRPSAAPSASPSSIPSLAPTTRMCTTNTGVAGDVLGVGTVSLLGGDLTDPENNGTRLGANYNADFDANVEARFNTGEGAFNVFNNVIGPSNAKWCCDPPPVWVSAGNFGLSTNPANAPQYLLTHFTITSGNDVSGRDADKWTIQGSDDQEEWTTIFEYNNVGSSPWTERNQVLRFSSPTHFEACAPYRYFRYFATSVVSGGFHQLNELEFFGDAVPN